MTPRHAPRCCRPNHCPCCRLQCPPASGGLPVLHYFPRCMQITIILILESGGKLLTSHFGKLLFS
ncbi:hypothetical protein CBM2637_B120170 [Cupriavidus taiwanensis]|nr:hypothetical protein CBM2637_B120170 [Cupriavidus taiwanensis]